jgi:hypothetical protein
MVRRLFVTAVILTVACMILAPAVGATVLFEDDFTPNGAIDSSKWFFAPDYTCVDSIATPAQAGAKLYSTQAFGGPGSGQITVEFLGLKLNSAGSGGDNWFGLFDFGAHWVGWGGGFRLYDGEVLAYPNNELYGPTWSGMVLNSSKSYDLRMVFAPGGSIDMYANETGAAEWYWLRNAPVATSHALQIQVYTDTAMISFDKIRVTTPTLVPEPGTVAALLLGISGLLGMVKLRKR